IYKYGEEINESARSNEVYNIKRVDEGNNKVLELVNTGITINNAVPKELHDATIEFWINPYSTTNYNQQIGFGWGTFLFHTTSSGNIYVGWNTGSDRITSTSGLLPVNTWTHVAVTIKSNVMTLYVNGVKKNVLTSSAYSGLAPISNFMIGDSYYKFNGKIDEFRIWDCCRTVDEIKSTMHKRVKNPATQHHLLTCFNMASVVRGDRTILPDCAAGRDVDITGLEGCKVLEDAALFDDGTTSLEGLNFAFEKAEVCVGETVTPVVEIPFGATKTAWSAPGAVVSAPEGVVPEFMFNKAGTYTVTLKAYDASDNMVEVSKQLTVNPQPMPVADFELSVDSVVAGDKVSLINRSVGDNLSYRWTMPGTETETATTTNASASYLETGMHPVTLTVTNEAGSASVTKYVRVTNAMPIVDFSVTPASIILGEKVALTDNSKYEPTKWLWTVSNDRHNVAINGKNYAYVPKAPGVYDVTLTVTNNMGTSTATQKRAFMVSNADPGNGLHFGGGSERIVFKSPMGAPSKAYTIDYWLFPYKCEGAANLYSDDGVFSMTTAANGETTLSVNKKSVASGEGYVISNEWHHYAVTCKSGTVVFYRDGEVFSRPSSRLSLTSPAWGGNITMGSADSPFEGMIDEFKFWGKSLSLDELQETCNRPVANPDSMKTHGSLVMYYDFNQTSGNVESKTDVEYVATRLDFGPDGDAWMSSLGV
ncbi:MAG: LamG-like jellyroll fold domain-containing protein, partial [Bacteroidaceae bacterium]|nr:LamG-like jellyroll fold domain-containing protein [Bacteroidaceae bacterium]